MSVKKKPLSKPSDKEKNKHELEPSIIVCARKKFNVDGDLRIHKVFTADGVDRYRFNWYKDDILTMSRFVHVQKENGGVKIIDKTTGQGNKLLVFR